MQIIWKWLIKANREDIRKFKTKLWIKCVNTRTTRTVFLALVEEMFSLLSLQVDLIEKDRISRWCKLINKSINKWIIRQTVMVTVQINRWLMNSNNIEQNRIRSKRKENNLESQSKIRQAMLTSRKLEFMKNLWVPCGKVQNKQKQILKIWEQTQKSMFNVIKTEINSLILERTNKMIRMEFTKLEFLIHCLVS